MRVVTSAQIAELDRRATEQHGLPITKLMDAAGRAVARAAAEMLRDRSGPVIVLTGKGNNGGDGLVAARYLAAQGVRVTAILTAAESEYAGEAQRALREARAAGVEVRAPEEVSELRPVLASVALIIDALFGTGFRGPARGLPAELIQAANVSKTPILAVDVPSGLNADTGQPDGPAVRAAVTVTMGLPKVGLLIFPGAELAGTIHVADIGYPPALTEDQTIRTYLVTADMVRRVLPRRPPDSHKGTYGRTLVVAGSVGFTGAAVLTSLGALRVGAGLVTLAVPQAVYPIVAAHVVEAMPTPLPDADGALSAAAVERLRPLVEISDAVAVGPGLSTAPGVRSIVESLLASGKPLVIDADGLNVLAGSAGIVRDARGPVVITPHPGELARLLGSSTPEILKDRLGVARSTAKALRCAVVLKGAATVVATSDGDACIIRTGNAGMATGGMGDVLTGTVASFIGQGMGPAEAAWTGAYLHGLAADLIVEERGMVGMLASEVADHLPTAIARVQVGTAPERIGCLRS